MKATLATERGRPVTEDLGASPLALRGLTVSYDSKPVVYAVDMTTQPGTMTAIIGPNGAGKSTLLKAALGIVEPLAGRVTAWGGPLKAARDRIAYVPQRASVDWDFPTRVLDVVMMGLYRDLGLLGRVKRRHIDRATDCLARGRDGGFRRPPDRPVVGRPAAAGLPCPCAGAGGRPLPAGRTFRRGRCRDRGGDHRGAQGASGRGPHGLSPCITTCPRSRPISTASS